MARQRLAVAVAALLLTAGPAAEAARAPRLTERCLTKTERQNAVSFRASDGVRLAGVVVGRGSTGVVLGHELRTDLCNWMPFARVLAKSGYRVLALDFRNSGSSGHAGGPRLWRLDRDLAAGATLLRARGSTKIVLGGASMGGTAALVAAATTPGAVAVAVISLSAPADFSSLDARAAVARVSVPTLLVAAAEDAGFADDARTLYAASAAPEKRIEIVSGGAHGTALLRGESGGAVRSLILDFLVAHAR